MTVAEAQAAGKAWWFDWTKYTPVEVAIDTEKTGSGIVKTSIGWRSVRDMYPTRADLSKDIMTRLAQHQLHYEASLEAVKRAISALQGE